MRRPRWLGGKGTGADDGSKVSADGDAGPAREVRSEREKGSGRSATAPKPASGAAERSAERAAARNQDGGGASSSARRRLADRVGRADASGGATAADERPPKPAAKGGGRPVKAESELKRSGGGKPKGTGGGKPKSTGDERKDGGEEAAKRLNRPRRQPTAATGDAKAGKKARDSGGATKAKRRPRSGDEDGSAARRAKKRGRVGGKDAGAARRRPRAKQRSVRRTAGAGAARFAAALKRGGIETWRWAAANGPPAGRALLVALGAVFALFFAVLGFVLNVLIGAWRRVAGPVHAVLGALDRTARAASRTLTPARALALVVAGAAILLALSQYADYRSLAIGNDAYSGVQTVAPAPETGRLQTGDAHSYVFVPVAIACLLLLAVATIGGRWRACRLVTLAGFAAIAVAVLVDRPAGLDPGEAAVSFEGVRATLIGGFYAQIAAGAALIVSSLMLARRLRLAGATRRVPAGERKGEAATGRGLRRRGPGTERTARA